VVSVDIGRNGVLSVAGKFGRELSYEVTPGASNVSVVVGGKGPAIFD